MVERQLLRQVAIPEKYGQEGRTAWLSAFDRDECGRRALRRAGAHRLVVMTNAKTIKLYNTHAQQDAIWMLPPQAALRTNPASSRVVLVHEHVRRIKKALC
jgi:hypothetical protein